MDSLSTKRVNKNIQFKISFHSNILRFACLIEIRIKLSKMLPEILQMAVNSEDLFLI